MVVGKSRSYNGGDKGTAEPLCKGLGLGCADHGIGRLGHVGPVLLRRSCADDDGVIPRVKRGLDFGPAHLFNQDFFQAVHLPYNCLLPKITLIPPTFQPQPGC
ncbi:hypothetical protein SDC9_145762 [bioreactor metagenome]|uniref:Uncharacterized protein n=1 Tax=bioreactor metagenome TaxID=1076179 RepID=A0A645E990_9ZZZZ